MGPQQMSAAWEVRLLWGEGALRTPLPSPLCSCILLPGPRAKPCTAHLELS